MKIIFFTNYSLEGASSRYRIYNYMNKYGEKGIKFGFTHFWGSFYLRKIIPQDNKVRRLLLLAFYYPLCILKRCASLLRAPFYDIIHIERDFCPGLPPWGEYIIAKLFKKKVVFEFDDAIYLTCKPEGKTEKVLSYSKGVITGNRILERYALQYCSNVVTVPTSIDSQQYWNTRQRIKKHENTVTIGWIGSFSTLKYLESLKDVFEELSKAFDIQLNVICNKELQWNNGVKINNIQWELNNYIEELCKFDIGIMPLLDHEWETGKCGFKLIQYMGVGLPIIASPVGVNKEMVKESVNGFLASTDKEWYEALSKLVTNKDVRQKMGEEGKKIVDNYYSTDSNLPILIEFFDKVYNS